MKYSQLKKNGDEGFVDKCFLSGAITGDEFTQWMHEILKKLDSTEDIPIYFF